MTIYDESRGPVWGWSTSEDEECWYGADSRADAEQEAEEQEDGGWIIEGRWPSPGLCAEAEAAGIAEDLLERMSDRDDVGGGDDPAFELLPGGEEALGLLLRCWAAGYVRVTQWAVVGKPIRVEPSPDPEKTA